MGGRIVVANRAVTRARYHLASGWIDNDRADRSLATRRCRLRLIKGNAHGGLIMSVHKYDPKGSGAPGQDGERVAKALARAGVASRREVERLIEAGKVALNGKVLTTPAVKVMPGDILTVDGAVVADTEPTRLFRYHKPVGLMTTHNDPKGRPTVFTALPPGLPRLISIGRLDINSEGLLLLTNDGGLARALELPSTGLVRRYRARARGRIDQAGLDKLKDGITVEGVRYGGIEAHLDKAKEDQTGANLWITVALTEGKNREVRRVLEAVGLKVNRLIRVAYGPFALGTLGIGQIEEVGPRVIREQMGEHIVPQNLPKGEKPQFTAPTTAPSRRLPTPGQAARKAEEAKATPKKVYKAGWAKAKIKNPGFGLSGATRPPKPAAVATRSPAPNRGAPSKSPRPRRGPGPRG